MSATTAGALKAFLEGLGLGIEAHRDIAPSAATLPYVTIREQVSMEPEIAFNQASDEDGHVREQVQLDLWQQWRDPSTKAKTEDPELPDAVVDALRNVVLETSPTRSMPIRVTSCIRLFEQDANLVHHAITVEVPRTLTRLSS